MSVERFDAVVIGAGPGGYPAAIRLGQLGVKTAIVEREYMGGVCLNVGCIPSKAVIHAAKTFEKIGHADALGITVGKPTLDMGKLQAWKGGVVNKLTSGVRTLLKALKSGRLTGLLPDQVPQNGEGVWADFFGKPAYTMTLPAKLHAMSGAPIVLTYAERKPRGQGFILRFMCFDAPLGDTPEQQARAINLAMEQLIARCPAQYSGSFPRGIRRQRSALRR